MALNAKNHQRKLKRQPNKVGLMSETKLEGNDKWGKVQETDHNPSECIHLKRKEKKIILKL